MNNSCLLYFGSCFVPQEAWATELLLAARRIVCQAKEMLVEARRDAQLPGVRASLHRVRYGLRKPGCTKPMLDSLAVKGSRRFLTSAPEDTSWARVFLPPYPLLLITGMACIRPNLQPT